MKEKGVTDFSGTSAEDITAKFNSVQENSEARRSAIRLEHAKQKENDAISQEFAQKAKDVAALMDQGFFEFNKFTEISVRDELVNAKGTLEEQLANVRSQHTNLESAGKSQLAEVEQAQNKQENAGELCMIGFM